MGRDLGGIGEGFGRGWLEIGEGGGEGFDRDFFACSLHISIK